MHAGLPTLLKRTVFAFSLCWPTTFALAYFDTRVATLALLILALVLLGPTLFVIAPLVVSAVAAKKRWLAIVAIVLGGCTVAVFEIRSLAELLRRSLMLQLITVSLLSLAVAATLHLLRPAALDAYKKEPNQPPTR
jgi:hypothetical protein